MGGGAGQSDSAAPEDVNGYQFLGQVAEGLDPKDLRSTVDAMKKRLGSGIGALIAVNDGRASVAVGVTDDLAGQVSAVDLVKVAVAALGGQGGAGVPTWPRAADPTARRRMPRSMRFRTRYRRSLLDRHPFARSRHLARRLPLRRGEVQCHAHQGFASARRCTCSICRMRAQSP